MLRPGFVYDELDKAVINIYIDYGFSSFPLDEREVCRVMGITLVPYSEYSGEDLVILMKKSLYGFFPPELALTSPTIFYNDTIDNIGCQRFSIFHEIKHYVFNDQSENPDQDDLAEHFGKFFMCPTPYLVLKDINDPDSVQRIFNTSYSVAVNVANSVKKRTAYRGKTIFDYEKPLIKLLLPDYYKEYFAGGDCL